MSSSDLILGLAFTGHGTSMCLLRDGRVAAAINLERLTRKKRTLMQSRLCPAPFPVDLTFEDSFEPYLQYILDAAGIRVEDLTLMATPYEGMLTIWEGMGDETKARFNPNLRAFFEDRGVPVVTMEHHECHQAQAFYVSPFEEAAILTVDGQGDHLRRHELRPISTVLAHGRGTEMETFLEVLAPHSLGAVYSYVTYFIGFGPDEEGKTMGLAPFGEPALYNKFREQLILTEDGFAFAPGSPWEMCGSFTDMGAWVSESLRGRDLTPEFEKHWGPRRKSKDEPLEPHHKDLAYAAQALTEEVLCHLARLGMERTGSRKLCIAGGVGLNSVGNYQILKRTEIEDLFICPNAGDRGLALGAAAWARVKQLGRGRPAPLTNDYLGRSYGDAEIESALQATGAKATRYETPEMLARAAQYLADGKILGWFQGGSEFGPRALGHRSILTRPWPAAMKDHLNARVKHREGFRPFAPSVLAEKAGEYFELDVESPYMLLVPPVREDKREVVPAICHVDHTARVQTVTAEDNDLYYQLIAEFDRITGVPVVLNTSFNVAGEAIVETPADALRCYYGTRIDILVLGNWIVEKTWQQKRKAR